MQSSKKAESTSTWIATARSDLANRVLKLRELARNYARNKDSSRTQAIIVGVCAMEKKAKSKPMKELLSFLPSTEFHIAIFDERMILNDPIETWPTCDVLISFYSDGFPLDKAEAYQSLHKPFMINDLRSQRLLFDRRSVYAICEEAGIPVPPHLIVNRDNYEGLSNDEIVEGEDYIEVKGKGRIDKPFVEKPVDADDHNVFIYYPRASGGGRKELFRKVGDRSVGSSYSCSSLSLSRKKD